MDPDCKCGRCRRKSCRKDGICSKVTPFEGLEFTLAEVAAIKTLKPPLMQKWKQLRHMWIKILALYQWLDPRDKGYIDIFDAVNWLDTLWRFRELGCINDKNCVGSMDQHTDACSSFITIIRNRVAATKLSVIDVLHDCLEDLPIWVGTRAVVEKNLFLHSVWSLMQNDARMVRKCEAWLQSICADDESINPFIVKGVVIPAPDLRVVSSFYRRPPEEQELPDPIPAENDVDRAENKRRLESAVRYKNALWKCQEKAERNVRAPLMNICRCGKRACSCPESVYIIAAPDDNDQNKYDECMLFKYPLLASRPEDEVRPNPEQEWRRTISEILRDWKK